MSDGSSGPAWGKCYQAVMRDPALSVNAKALYAYLASFSDEQGRCYPSVSVIREEIGLKSNDRYYATLHELQDRGILTINKLKRGNRFAKNEYVLYAPAQSGNRTVENRSTEQSGNRSTEQSGSRSIEQSGSRSIEQSDSRSIEQSDNRTTNRPPIYRSLSYRTQNNTLKRNAQKTEKENAIITICNILNSKRWKRCLQIKGGDRYLYKPEGMTWKDVISAAYQYIAQFPDPTQRIQNDGIQWYSFMDYLETMSK